MNATVGTAMAFDWTMIDDRDGGSRTWSGWRGAYRIVTDGGVIVAEDEEAIGPAHGRGHSELSRDFHETYPERRDARLLSGWLIQTADGSGYGLLHYGAGQRLIERARRRSEAWLGKPVHVLDPWDPARVDPKVYAIHPDGGAIVGYLETD